MESEREVEGGSAAHQSRNIYSHGSLPRPRLKSSLLSGPSTVGQTPARPRRQPSADHSLLTEAGRKVQKIKHSLRPRPVPATTRVESSCVRSTKSRTLPTGVTGHERVPLITPTRAGAHSKKSRSNLREPTTTRRSSKPEVNENTVNNPQKAGESKAISTPLRRSASSILNVGLFDVATVHATQPSAYLSIDTLDDLSRWDMDSLPSIPSPPDSPGLQTTFTTTTPSIFSNPFSAPIDDDASIENEIPFPFNRHSKVVREDMGIKKSKNKGLRNLSGNILNRYVVPPIIDPPPTVPPQSALPGLPHPLPLRTLCQNTTSPHPLLSPTPSAIPSKAKLTPPKAKSPSGPSSSKKDAWGCMHLGASDCELSIAFPQTSHFEVWDMGDDSHIAVPALLCLMAKDAHAWSGLPLALPDVTFIDLRCSDVPLPSRMSVYDPSQEYTTRYIGPQGKRTPPTHAASAARARAPAPAIDADDITLDGTWVRTYAPPGAEGARGRGARILRHAAVADAFARAAGPGVQAPARGWYLQFWVPVPTRLFARRETRVFRVDARVWMMGDEARVLSLDENTQGEVHPLVADTQMTVSHLRTPREMDGVWWC
ncbi:hypothetical protein BJ912DRAFT_1085940 [Pholiota molesta]|nr:hypothetical protein BJ912DRAFT_1085940 [Pholiota molesta]